VTAGLSPKNMAAPDRILAVDVYGTAVVFGEFGHVIAPGVTRCARRQVK
jgi:hypothetical protein